MEKEFKLDEMMPIIEMFNLKPYYSTLQKEEKSYIVETWKSKSNPYLILNRVFEFNQKNIETIEPKKRKSLLGEMLNKSVEIENYEEAAKLRDMIILMENK